MNKTHVIILFAVLLITGCMREENDNAVSNQISIADDSVIVEEVEGPNLMINGGVEDWTIMYNGINLIDYWLAHNNNNVKMDWHVVYEGHYSAKMESIESGETARIDQVVQVTPGSKIRIRFKYYVKKWQENGSRTYCYFRTSAAESSVIPISELREFYSDDEYYIIRGGGYGLKYLPHTLNKWITFDQTIMVPPTANYFVFGVNSYYETTIYVDDCYVGEVRCQMD